LTDEVQRKNLLTYQLLGDPEISITAVPPEPSIDVEKRVWSSRAEDWVEENCVLINDNVTFNCTIRNDGTWRDLTMIVVTDILSESLAYAGNARVDGEPWEPAMVGANEFVWEFPPDRALPVGESIFIEFDAEVVSWSAEPEVNLQMADAWCEEAETQVYDEDTAAVRPCIPGDANLDGDVDGGDVLYTRYIVAGYLVNLTVESDGCCDVTVTTNFSGGGGGGTVLAGETRTFFNLWAGETAIVSADDSSVGCAFQSWSDGGAQTHDIVMVQSVDVDVTATCY